MISICIPDWNWGGGSLLLPSALSPASVPTALQGGQAGARHRLVLACITPHGCFNVSFFRSSSETHSGRLAPFCFFSSTAWTFIFVEFILLFFSCCGYLGYLAIIWQFSCILKAVWNSQSVVLLWICKICQSFAEYESFSAFVLNIFLSCHKSTWKAFLTWLPKILGNFKVLMPK